MKKSGYSALDSSSFNSFIHWKGLGIFRFLHPRPLPLEINNVGSSLKEDVPERKLKEIR